MHRSYIRPFDAGWAYLSAGLKRCWLTPKFETDEEADAQSKRRGLIWNGWIQYLVSHMDVMDMPSLRTTFKQSIAETVEHSGSIFGLPKEKCVREPKFMNCETMAPPTMMLIRLVM